MPRLTLVVLVSCCTCVCTLLAALPTLADDNPPARDKRTRPGSKPGEVITRPDRTEAWPDQIRVGNAAPEFELPLLNETGKHNAPAGTAPSGGKRAEKDAVQTVALRDWRAKQPVVLIFGSITCPPFRAQLEHVDALYDKFKDRARFLFVYIREAHPDSILSVVDQAGTEGLLTIAQAADLPTRTATAAACQRTAKLKMPVVVDTIDNSVGKAYAGWPNRMVVVGTDGRIIFASDPKPNGTDARRLQAYLAENLPAKDAAPATSDAGKKPLPGTREYEWLKFARPPDWIVDNDSGYPAGPEGTPWERHYKSLVRTSAKAVAEGLPSHEQAIKEIDASAAASNAQTQQHKMFVLSVVHQSEGRRPDSATEALREVFGRLVDREFKSDWNYRNAEVKLPFKDDPQLVIHRDAVYGTDDPASQRLDAYLVKSDKPTPVLIEFHGGGWRRGSRNDLEQYKGDLMRQVLAAGISLVSVDYRLAPTYRFPAQMQDAARAVQFVRSKAREWNIDPNRISAIGGSAGGHLLTWVALNDDQANLSSSDPVARQSSRLTCFIIQWAPVDLTRIKPLELQRSGPRGLDAANAFCSVMALQPEDYGKPESQPHIRAASPVFEVTSDDPPGFLMFGGTPEGFNIADPPPVPETINDPHSYWWGVILAGALKKAGVAYTPHFGPSVGKDASVDNPAILKFLRTHFGML